MAMMVIFDYTKCNYLHSVFRQLISNSEAITLKCIVVKTTIYAQSCLKCFTVYLLSHCLEILEKKLLDCSNIQFMY